MALLYVFLTTVVAFWIGRPLIRLTFRNEATNAAFRYALVRAARRRRGRRPLPRRARRTRSALTTRFAAIITNYRAFVRRGIALPRLEQVDEPDRRARCRTIVAGAPVVRGPRYSSATSRNRRARSCPCTTRWRSSAPSTTRSPATARRIIRLDGLVDRQRNEQGSYRAMTVEGEHRRRRSSSTMSRSERPPAGDGHRSTRSMSGWTPGDSLVITGTVGHRQDHAAAQPGATVAVHLAAPCATPRSGGTMFLSQLPYVPLGNLRAVISLSRRPPRYVRRRRDSARARRRGAGHLGDRAWTRRPTGRRCCPRRAAAHRVRAGAAEQTDGGVPRRVDLGARRGPGVRACTRRCAPSCPTAWWSASATATASSSTTDRRLELLGGRRARRPPARWPRPALGASLPPRAGPLGGRRTSPSPSCVPLAYPLPSGAMLAAQAPAAYRPNDRRCRPAPAPHRRWTHPSRPW